MKYFFSVIITITLLESGVFWYYNNLFSDQNAISVAAPVKAKDTTQKTKTSNLELIANEKVKLISISENGQFVAYVNESNKLHIINLQTKKELFSTMDNDSMVSLNWIRSDSLFVGLKSKNGSLILKTIQLGSQKERIINTYSNVTPTSTFKSIIFSPYTNDVYTLIGNDNITKMYHFDTNGTMTLFPLKFQYIENPTMLSSKNILFFEDKLKNIWMNQNKTLEKIETNATLLAVYGDTVYFGSLNNAGEVISIYSYKGGVKHKIYELPSPILGSQILIKKDGNILYAKGDKYYNKNLKKSYPLPKASTVLVENHKLFILTQDKVYLINDSQ